jgi:hypothetical protein
MYLHKPFLWDFLSNWFDHNNKKNFYYYSSLHDSRYMTYCDLLFQSIYNYWDKIGDLLAFYFVPKLNGKEFYFSKVLKKIPTDYKKSHNFLWLLEFDKNDYSDLNSKRIQTVHYSNYSSSFKENWMANVSNEVGIEKLQNEISSLTDYFKIHLEKVIIGFEKALNLIDEVK